MLSPKESGPDRARSGKTYDWTKYHCKYDDTWIEIWTPQEAD